MIVDLLVLSLISSGANAFSMQTLSTSTAEQIQGAMSLTIEGQSNITASHLAVSMWSSILDGETETETETKTKVVASKASNPLQPSIRALCNPLYASSLSRIGRDRDAVNIYDETLSYIKEVSMDDNVLMDIRIGKAESLQRLIRYEEARREFLAASYLGWGMGKAQHVKAAKCTYSASICALRQADLRGAESILYPVFKGVHDLSSIESNLVGLYGTVRFELDRQDASISTSADEDEKGIFFNPIQMMKHAASSGNISPIYQWMYAVASKSTSCYIFQSISSTVRATRDTRSNVLEDKDKFLRVASINQSPFDDPALINLDDKILLHDLLKNYPENCCWPDGFVLPRDKAALIANHNQDKRWMSKERAGYGSHGNKIVTTQEAVALFHKNDDDQELTLCQKLIDPSMLLDNRKFSIRVYVVFFNQGGKIMSYLLNNGLVKLAEVDYDRTSTSTSASDGMYMTNSGRIEGDAMTQHGLDYLQRSLKNTYGSGAYESFWKEIKDSVTHVIRAFGAKKRDDRTMDNDNENSLFTSVPKIFGFDYIVDSLFHPVLLEVNRFPGLEARGDSDDNVKFQVVQTAWMLASKLSRMDCGFEEAEMKNIHSKSTLLTI